MLLICSLWQRHTPPGMNEQNTRIELWRRLIEPSSLGLLEAAAAGDIRNISWLQGLRDKWGGDLASVALELLEARRRAAASTGAEWG